MLHFCESCDAEIPENQTTCKECEKKNKCIDCGHLFSRAADAARDEQYRCEECAKKEAAEQAAVAKAITELWNGAPRADGLYIHGGYAEPQGGKIKYPLPPEDFWGHNMWGSLINRLQQKRPMVAKAINARAMCLLSGPSGTGKTSVMWATIHNLLTHNRHKTVHFVDWADLYEFAGDAHNFTSEIREHATKWLGEFARADALFIDDLGGIEADNRRQVSIHKLINERRNHRRLTFATVNLDDTEIAERLGGAIASRFSTRIEINGEDLRKVQTH